LNDPLMANEEKRDLEAALEEVEDDFKQEPISGMQRVIPRVRVSALQSEAGAKTKYRI
jgi:hypothetical protein